MTTPGLHVHKYISMFTCVHTNTHTTHGREEKQELAITETDNMPSVTWAHYKHYSTFNQNKPAVQTGAQSSKLNRV